MSELGFINHFVNKSVDFRFHGRNLTFHLSQSLFSSHDVDHGTRHLLKTLALGISLDEVDTLLDVGCGVGILGISLKKRHPKMRVTFQDRDALALSFTEINSKLNQIGAVELGHGLALDGLQGKKFDLIVSNLPGKAGPPVLKKIIQRMPGSLTGSGRAAVVIVKPLAGLVQETILENGSRILLEERAKGYVAFHFSDGSADQDDCDLSAYLRGNYPFPAGKTIVHLKSAYNIPGFDTLTYQTRLAARLLRDQQIEGKVLFWNPGQGYLPVLLTSNPSCRPSQVVLAGRDLLSLQVAELNLQEHGVSSRQIVTSHRPHFMDMDGKFDFIILMPDIDPGVPWTRVLLDKSTDLLHPGGGLLLTAKSAFVHRLLAIRRGLTLENNKRRDGYRSLLLSNPKAF